MLAWILATSLSRKLQRNSSVLSWEQQLEEMAEIQANVIHSGGEKTVVYCFCCGLSCIP